MRTIKFRGKKIYGDGWAYGLLSDIDEQDEIAELCMKFGIEYVHLNTVGQFTGLHDKNGKEIYEGDIIRSFDSTGQSITHTICWCESCAKFAALLDSYSKYGKTFCDLDENWIEEFDKVVIGNIHENKNLMEGGEK
jgi:uncharacterized phage protein (TIGR01671 family)